MAYDEIRDFLPKDVPSGGGSGEVDEKISAHNTNSTSHPDKATKTELAQGLATKAALSHTHTPTQVGLSNVDNTSDANKPVSTLQQAALDSKAALAHTHTKDQVGLANVDNTSDANKPVSTAAQQALAGKSDTSHGHTIAGVTGLQTALDGKAPTSHSHAGTAVSIDPSGFNKNLNSTVTDAQKLATAVDQLTTGGGSSDVIGIRKLASVDGLTDWGSPSGAGMALSVSDVVGEKINGRFPYRLDCTGAVAGTYVPLPITVTEFEAGSTTGLSLWVKPGTGYVHGYLEAVLYDPDTAEILEPDVTLIRTGAHRHAWRVNLNGGTSYEVWLRVTAAGGGHNFSLAFDDVRVAKDVTCGRWIWPFGGPFSTSALSSVTPQFHCFVTTSGITSGSSSYHTRYHASTKQRLRGFRVDAANIKFDAEGRLMEISLAIAESLPYSAGNVGALLDPDTTFVLTGMNAIDVKLIKNNLNIILNSTNSCTFILYTSIDTSCTLGALSPALLVEAN